MQTINNDTVSINKSLPVISNPSLFQEFLPKNFFPIQLVLDPGCVRLKIAKPVCILGRHSLSDVRLSYPFISRRHCYFEFKETNWYVHDLNSMNGIFVNGKKVESCIIQSGDSLGLIGISFLIEFPLSHRQETKNIHDDRYCEPTIAMTSDRLVA